MIVKETCRQVRGCRHLQLATSTCTSATAFPGGAHPGDYNQYPIATLLYCVCVFCGASAMSSAIKMSHILMQANAALVETLVKALREVGHAPTVSPLPRFLGRPDSPGGPTIDESLSSFDLYVRQCGVAEGTERCY